MLVMLAPGQGSMSINKEKKFFAIAPGEKREVDFWLVRSMLEEGILVKAEYPEILNDGTASVKYDGLNAEVSPAAKPGNSFRRGK